MDEKINTSSSGRTYFPNLDGLRFIGSLIIIILHMEDIKIKQNIAPYHFLAYYMPVGNIDVSLFFVLSGFLITYLLLKEKTEHGEINLKNYYARRTLRIWPLYYLVLILGFFILPHIDKYANHAYSSNLHSHFWIYFLASCLFLSPFARTSSGLPETIGPIWSVGVEELFYLCWPLFLKKTKKYLWLFLGIILLVVLVRNSLFLSDNLFHIQDSYRNLFVYARSIFLQYRISCMALGAIGAYLFVFKKNKILSILYRKDIQWLVYMITLLLLAFKIGVKGVKYEKFPSISYELYSLLFAIIILNLATNPQSVINLNYKWMTYLGKVSYGLYMYHPIMRILSLEITEHCYHSILKGWQMNAIFYSLTLSSTILVSILSYEFFEKRLLKLKRRFKP